MQFFCRTKINCIQEDSLLVRIIISFIFYALFFLELLTRRKAPSEIIIFSLLSSFATVFFFFQHLFPCYRTKILSIKIVMPLKVWYLVFVISVTLCSEETDNDPPDRQEKSKLYLLHFMIPQSIFNDFIFQLFYLMLSNFQMIHAQGMIHLDE